MNERARPRRLLLLAYYFPPLAGMASVRAERFARRLPELGWVTTVITPRDGMYHRRAEPWQAPQGVSVVRTGSLELSRLARRGYAAIGGDVPEQATEIRGARTGRLGGWLRRLLHDIVYLPDAQIGWYPFALAAARRALRSSPHDVVLTSSVPYTSHLVGLALRRRRESAWVAELRDPFAGSLVRTESSRWRRWLDRRLERRILGRADRVVVTAQDTRAALLEAHPGVDPDRIVVVTNSFDPTMHPRPRPPAPDAPLRLVHAGSLLSGFQDPRPLVEAAARIEREREGSVRIVALGPAAEWERARDSVDGAARWIELRGIVTPAVVHDELAGASALLILTPGERFRDVLAGKTFEWLGARRPALVVAHPDGELARLVARSSGGVLAGENRCEAIEPALRRLIELQRKGELESLCPGTDVAAEFELAVVSRRLASVLEEAVQEARIRSDRRDQR